MSALKKELMLNISDATWDRILYKSEPSAVILTELGEGAQTGARIIFRNAEGHSFPRRIKDIKLFDSCQMTNHIAKILGLRDKREINAFYPKGFKDYILVYFE